VQAVVNVSTRDRQRSPDAVHVRQSEPEVVELVQRLHVERLIIVVDFLALLMFSTSHLLVQPAYRRLRLLAVHTLLWLTGGLPLGPHTCLLYAASCL